LYADALGLTGARRLGHRVRQDMEFRFLAAGKHPDFWMLNAVRQRHRKALNDLFTQGIRPAVTRPS
jgi:hypothetical protein